MPVEPLNVIALISGGKDSFHSLLHCVLQGHRIVAIANLYPPGSHDSGIPPAESLDLNSHMYQTAGHSLIHLYAQVLPYPLYRAPISGIAIDQEKEYTPIVSRLAGSALTTKEADTTIRAEDETEALLPLLRGIIQKHPEANALSTGAIQSTYQRTRVESVCQRLGLISLAFLWQYDAIARAVSTPDALLEDIARAGLDARIVKVASGGLDDSLLWSSLAEAAVRNRIQKAMQRFGGSVLGEGGEYETLVVSGPPELWRGRIEVDKEDRKIVRAGGGEAFISFQSAKLIKTEQSSPGQLEDLKDRIYQPHLWDPQFQALLNEFDKFGTTTPLLESEPGSTAKDLQWYPHKRITKTTWSLNISNLTSAEVGGPELQMQAICDLVRSFLATEGLTPSDIIFTTILLRSMTDFGHINSIYGCLFKDPLPPARVTIGVGDCLPSGIDVMLSITATFVPRYSRRGLHVQSRSYWAPANIGPYSQAIATELGQRGNALTYIAGQIPLSPATMQVLEVDELPIQNMFLRHALLSAQHLWRIGATMGVSWWPGAVAFLASDGASVGRARLAEQIWKSLNRTRMETMVDEDTAEDEVPDLWEQRYGGNLVLSPQERLNKKATKIRCLGSEHAIAQPSGFLAVEVAETPRGCLIEWQGIGVTAEYIRLGCHDRGIYATAGEAPDLPVTVCFHEFRTELEAHQGLKEHEGWGHGQDSCSTRPKSWSCVLYTSAPGRYESAQVQVVPCRRLWGSGGHEIVAGLVAIGNTDVEMPP